MREIFWKVVFWNFVLAMISMSSYLAFGLTTACSVIFILAVVFSWFVPSRLKGDPGAVDEVQELGSVLIFLFVVVVLFIALMVGGWLPWPF